MILEITNNLNAEIYISHTRVYSYRNDLYRTRHNSDTYKCLHICYNIFHNIIFTENFTVT